MYQRIKLGDIQKTFVVSDLHFNHNRDFIWARRGFSDSLAHNVGLVEEWNNRVSNEDCVFHLGDTAFGDSNGAITRELIKKLNFKRLYLMGGNHLSGFGAIYKKAVFDFFGHNNLEVFPLNCEVEGREVVFLPNLVEIVVDGVMFVLCHYPILSHNSQANGTYMVCGHSHGNCALTNSNTGKGRRVDVGIENFGGPVSLQFVMNHLKDRDLDCVDHH